MSKKTFDALRRADGVFAGALLAVLVTTGAAAAINSYPSAIGSYTEQLPELRPSILHEASLAVEKPFAVEAPNAAAISRTAEELAELKVVAQVNCLAQAMYYEARGEGRDGQEAVAEVIFHRMHRAGYPRTVCGVVYQGASLDTGCQFSFTCDGELHHAKSPRPWAEVRRLAAAIVEGRLHLSNMTGGATSFHAVDVTPGWADTMSETVQIGNHIFYRPLVRTQSS